MIARQTENSGKLVVTIFYPDATSGARLAGAVHRVVRNLGGGDALDPRPWRLDILEWPEMQAQAAHDIACCDIVVVPADDAYAGSTFFRRWAETWPGGRDRRRLLLATRCGVAETPSRPQQFADWLRELAARKGMDWVPCAKLDAAPAILPGERSKSRLHASDRPFPPGSNPRPGASCFAERQPRPAQ